MGQSAVIFPGQGAGMQPNEVICDNAEVGGAFSPLSRIMEDVNAEEQDI